MPPSRKNSRRGLWFLLLAAIALTVGCSSEPIAPPPAKPRLVDGQTAEQMIEALRARYREADVYMDNAEFHERFAFKGEGSAYQAPPHVVSVVFARPNKFRITRQVPETEAPGLTVVAMSDGDKLQAIVTDLPKQLLQLPAPESLDTENVASDPILREQLLPVPLANLFPQLDLLVGGEKSTALAGTSYLFLDDMTLDSGSCYRIRVATEEGDRVAWIDCKTKLLRRLDMPAQQARKVRDPDDRFSQYELWIDFPGATTDVTIPDGVFQLEAPAGAAVVPAFEDTAAGGESPAKTTD